MLRENMKSTNVEETIDRFWDMFIVDALIGNFDRHGGNWGFIKKDNQYRIAPVYDNGSSPVSEAEYGREAGGPYSPPRKKLTNGSISSPPPHQGEESQEFLF